MTVHPCRQRTVTANTGGIDRRRHLRIERSARMHPPVDHNGMICEITGIGHKGLLNIEIIKVRKYEQYFTNTSIELSFS